MADHNVAVVAGLTPVAAAIVVIGIPWIVVVVARGKALSC